MPKPGTPIEINFIHKNYGKIGKVQAFETGIPGIVVHRIYEMINNWTIAHESGFRIGGVFPSRKDAIRAANFYFGKIKFNMRIAPEELTQKHDFVQAAMRLRKGYKNLKMN